MFQTFYRLIYSFISFIAKEVSEDEDSDGSEEDLEDTNHVGDQNGGQPPQAKKLRRWICSNTKREKTQTIIQTVSMEYF